jgi:hypothetical protein
MSPEPARSTRNERPARRPDRQRRPASRPRPARAHLYVVQPLDPAADDLLPLPPQAATQRRRAVFRLRRLLAAAVAGSVLAAVVAVGVWVVAGGVDSSTMRFTGTWSTPNNLLGTTPLVITGQGATYTLNGLGGLGTPSASATFQNGMLVASGGSGVNRWRLQLQLLDDNRQLMAHLSRGSGPPQTVLYTNL